MRLKHLEVHGFKTFASRLELVFPTGITAVVGPNGSGKSNIADAVRWVLGEQSFSTLRAKKSEDLIFDGGEGRSRSGMAEVYLTLDNADGFFPIEFSEVTIGRRAYRDGDNEYLLNGNKVRLRDIAELLSQTGLARRTYTVIGQGLIDQALSLRAEERRALFEEAAGISLYQHKREDALRKLDETQRNLDRVKDILAEIGPRVRQLERQARRAQDYGRLSADLTGVQRTWYGYHWGRLQAALRDARESSQVHEELVGQRRAELKGAGQRLEDLRRRQQEVRAQASQWQRDSSGLRGQVDALQRQIAVLSERARLLRRQADDARADLSPLEAQLAEQRERAAQAEIALVEATQRIDNQSRDIEAARRALEERQAQRQTASQAIAEAQAALRLLESDAADIRNRRAQLSERRAVLETEQAAHQHAVDALDVDLTDQRALLASADSEIAQIEAQMDARRAQHAELDGELAAIRARQAELDAESAHALRGDAELRARYDALKAARATLAGFESGARSILSARLPGVKGAVARMIHVEAGWERAIEAALGTDLQAILVDAWTEAEAARRHLDAQQTGGRATLVPLDSLRAHHYALPPGVRRAVDLVVCDDGVRPAIDALLGNIVAVDDLAQARQLMPGLPPGVHAVTRTGDVLRSSGAIMLGRAAGSGALVTHEREWRELPDRIRATADRAAAIEARRTQESASAEEVTRRQAAAADDLRRLGGSLTEKQSARDATARRVESIEREIDWKRSLIAQARAEAEDLVARDGDLSAEQERRAQAELSRRQTMAELENRLEQLPVEDAAARLTTLQTAAAVADQLRQGHESVWRTHRAALEQAQQQLDARRQRIEAIAGEQSGIEHELAELRRQEADLDAQLAAHRARIDPAEAELRDLESAHARAEDEERAARNRLQEIESRHNLSVMEAARKEDELNHMRERIDEELGLVQLELADLSGPQPLPLSPIVTELPSVAQLPEGLEAEMQRLKAQLRRLGPINPDAQAEFTAERERYDFLNTQSNDLSQAIEQLQQVIAELDQLMEQSFSQTFAAIAEEFKSTFGALFGGGSARLVLTEPDDLSQTGVDIVARPPGKKQQGLALLSGGERSLTAAALLFAILRVKPPPFCIMDETDAALDEANVGRFREMIRRQGEATQFVLITHNRGTIEAADTIYGVTMERDSSSRVYSLKLEGDRIAA